MAQAGPRYKGVDLDKYDVSVVSDDMANDNGQRKALVDKLKAAGYQRRAQASCDQIPGDVYVRKVADGAE